MKKTEEQIGIRKKTAKMYIEENKELKKELKKYKHYYDRDKEELMESCYALKKENEELKDKLLLTENDRDEWEVKAKDFEKRLNKLLDNMSWMS